MAQRIPLPLTVSCFSKIQFGFTFLVPAHPGSPGQRAIKWVCVSVWQYATIFWEFVLRCKEYYGKCAATRYLVPTLVWTVRELCVTLLHAKGCHICFVTDASYGAHVKSCPSIYCLAVKLCIVLQLQLTFFALMTILCHIVWHNHVSIFLWQWRQLQFI